MWLHVLILVLHRSFKFSTEFRYLRLQSPGLCYSVKGRSIPCHAFQVTSAYTGRLSIFPLSNLFDLPWSILTLAGWRMSWVISWDHCVSGLLYQGHLCVSCAPCPRFMCWKQQDVRIFWPTLLITAFYTSISSPSFNTAFLWELSMTSMLLLHCSVLKSLRPWTCCYICHGWLLPFVML